MWSSTEMSQSRLRCVGHLQLSDRHVLDLLEGADAVGAALAAEAALLVATARRVRAEHARVDVDRAGAQPARDLRSPPATSAPYTCAGEPVDAVVGDAHGVVEVVVGEHPDHRAEDLLLRRRVGVVGQVEHGRLEVVAAVEAGRPAAAGRDLAAVLLGEADEPLAALALARR